MIPILLRTLPVRRSPWLEHNFPSAASTIPILIRMSEGARRDPGQGCLSGFEHAAEPPPPHPPGAHQNSGKARVAGQYTQGGRSRREEGRDSSVRGKAGGNFLILLVQELMAE